MATDLRCGTCGECLHTCYCERECECGEVAKWSFSENGGVCVCPRPLPVSRELEKNVWHVKSHASSVVVFFVT